MPHRLRIVYVLAAVTEVIEEVIRLSSISPQQKVSGINAGC